MNVEIPETDDDSLQNKLEDLSESILESDVWTDIQIEENIESTFEDIHGISINTYLQYVKSLTESGMNYSAARAYALEKYTDGSVIGTTLYGTYQSSLTGVSIEAHSQLMNDAEKQSSETKKLNYITSSHRPLQIISMEEIQGYSEFAEGEFTDEYNPPHHKTIILIGEYLSNDAESDIYEFVGDEIPQYVIFFEKYVGDGIKTTMGNSRINMHDRLHSVDVEYLHSVDEVEEEINDYFKYSKPDMKRHINNLLDPIK